MEKLKAEFVLKLSNNTWTAWNDGIAFACHWRLVFLRLFFDYMGGNRFAHILALLLLWPFGDRKDQFGVFRATYPAYLWLCGYGSPGKALFSIIWYGIPALAQVSAVALCYQLYHLVHTHFPAGILAASIRLTALLVVKKITGPSLPYLQKVTQSATGNILKALLSSRGLVLPQFILLRRQEQRKDALARYQILPGDVLDWVYEPLGRGEIRLVHISPDPVDGTARYSLVTTRLEEAQSYHAISYVWGATAEMTHKLPVGGKWLGTIASAFEILHDHVPCWSPPSGGYYWIDSVCINQKDLDERSRQVEMMGSIYSRADDVISYVRPDNLDHVDVASTFFFNLRSDVVQQKRRSYGLSTFGLGSLFDPKFREFIKGFMVTTLDLTPSPGWAALSQVFSSRYWRRMWIVQEIVLAQKLRIYYGDYEFDWRHLLRLAENRPADMQFIDFSDANSVKGEGMESSRSRILHTLMHRKMHEDGIVHELGDLLMSCRRMSAGNPRDKIYGIYGLLASWKPPATIAVDYTTSLKVLYVNVATHFITHGDPEWLMCMASPGYSQRRTNAERSCTDCCSVSPICDCHDLPSWVPDWREQCPPWILPGALIKPVSQVNTIRERMAASIHDQSLSLFSWHAGHIVTLTPLPFPTILAPHDLAQIGFEAERYYRNLSLLLETMSTVPSTYHTGEMATEALARTLMPGNCDDDVVASFTASWRVYESFRSRLSRFRQGIEISTFSDGLVFGSISRELLDALQAAGADGFLKRTVACSMRSLAILNTGYFALVPQYSELGDVVHMLRGAESFFVLRHRKSGGFGFVGDCYVHGTIDFDVEARRIEIH
jgi:hypothetical protein